MTPLRNKMIRELELHRKAAGTIKQYVSAVAELARHYRRSPDSISIEEVRDFIHHLITQRKVAFSTCNTRLAGIRFFFQQVLRRDDFPLRVPAKRSGRLPEPLSRSEIARLFDATTNTKHRVLLMTTYGGGLRVAELVHLRPQDIHSERMLMRVNQGKGHKDRYTLLSPRLLEELRAVASIGRRSGCFQTGTAAVPCQRIPPRSCSTGPRNGRTSGMGTASIRCGILLRRI